MMSMLVNPFVLGGAVVVPPYFNNGTLYATSYNTGGPPVTLYFDNYQTNIPESEMYTVWFWTAPGEAEQYWTELTGVGCLQNTTGTFDKAGTWNFRANIYKTNGPTLLMHPNIQIICTL